MSGCSRSIVAVFAFFLILVVPLVAGCGGGSSDDEFTGARGQVSGTITLDGQPLQQGCQVLFMAEKGGYTATGVVGDDGRYTLIYGGGKGLPVGDYKVQVSAPVAVDSSGADTTVDPAKMASQMKLEPGAHEPEDTGPVPLKYRSTDTSTLRFKVEANQNTADFKLEKK
ncbi:MAG: carboxypeptidase-like regulatory domain-containing protein [Planctomycetota bacterium]